jgi:hypothetical protein
MTVTHNGRTYTAMERPGLVFLLPHGSYPGIVLAL